MVVSLFFLRGNYEKWVEYVKIVMYSTGAITLLLFFCYDLIQLSYGCKKYFKKSYWNIIMIA